MLTKNFPNLCSWLSHTPYKSATSPLHLTFSSASSHYSDPYIPPRLWKWGVFLPLSISNLVVYYILSFPSSIKKTRKGRITGWAIREGADSLVLYLNDHGGDDTFRISESETLSSSDLDSWLDELQASITGKITVIYEACESGSFVDELEDDDRIIIASTLPGEQAKFLNHRTISFSYFFWSNIFNGLTIDESFSGASQAVNFTFSDQTPQLNGVVGNLSIGNGIKGMLGEASRDRSSIPTPGNTP